jgi:hypothetical protein
MYWSSLYDPSMAVVLRDHFPLLSNLVGVQPDSLTPEVGRYRFFKSRDHLRFAQDKLAARGVARANDRLIVDIKVPSFDSSCIRAQAC